MKVKSVSPGPRYQPLVQLLRASEALWNASRVFLTRWNLSPSQFNVLNLLHGRPAGCTQVELSRQLIMHRSNVTGLVDRLAARGLIERRDSPRDRRAFNVVLTVAGRKLMQQIQPHYYRAAEAVWGKLTVNRAKELVAELEKIGANASRIARGQKRA